MTPWKLGLGLAVAVAFTSPPAGAELEQSDWEPIFHGIEYATGYSDEPRRQQVYAVRIDLQAEGIEFLSTPSNGPADLETNGQTVRSFLDEHDLSVAINANFFDPCCDDIPGQAKNVLGLAVSDGELVSPGTAEPTSRGAQALLVSRDNVVRLEDAVEASDLSGVWNAVAGSPWLVRDGVNVGEEGDWHPRTLVGLTEDERYLIWIVVDGRNINSFGTTDKDSGDWLLRFGAHNGLNLDGGGSTTLVRMSESGGTVLNVPSAGERVNGNNIGVRALPLMSGAGGTGGSAAGGSATGGSVTGVSGAGGNGASGAESGDSAEPNSGGCCRTAPGHSSAAFPGELWLLLGLGFGLRRFPSRCRAPS